MFQTKTSRVLCEKYLYHHSKLKLQGALSWKSFLTATTLHILNYKGSVVSCKATKGAFPENSVYTLVLAVSGEKKPQPGQFYMLHPLKSDTLLGRPISVFHFEQKKGFVEITFLILVKGIGTKELSALQKDDEISILGPLGNVFPKPENGKALIIGCGIGIAPVAGFAESLKDKTYDFYASFRSGKYGLEYIKPDKLVITTDDGSEGIKGMLPTALSVETLKDNNYSAVYVCGPAPLLEYVKQIRRSWHCLLS